MLPALTHRMPFATAPAADSPRGRAVASSLAAHVMAQPIQNSCGDVDVTCQAFPKLAFYTCCLPAFHTYVLFVAAAAVVVTATVAVTVPAAVAGGQRHQSLLPRPFLLQVLPPAPAPAPSQSPSSADVPETPKLPRKHSRVQRRPVVHSVTETCNVEVHRGSPSCHATSSAAPPGQHAHSR